MANEEKSIWFPVQCLSWLGHTFDLVTGQLSINSERIEALKSEIVIFLENHNKVSARKVAKVTGMIASMHFVLQELARLMMRSLYSRVSNSLSWDSFFSVSLDSSEYKELAFWSQNRDSLNSRCLLPDIKHLHSVSAFSDACDVGCAAFIPQIGNCHIAHREWT